MPQKNTMILLCLLIGCFLNEHGRAQEKTQGVSWERCMAYQLAASIGTEVVGLMALSHVELDGYAGIALTAAGMVGVTHLIGCATRHRGFIPLALLGCAGGIALATPLIYGLAMGGGQHAYYRRGIVTAAHGAGLGVQPGIRGGLRTA